MVFLFLIDKQVKKKVEFLDAICSDVIRYKKHLPFPTLELSDLLLSNAGDRSWNTIYHGTLNTILSPDLKYFALFPRLELRKQVGGRVDTTLSMWIKTFDTGYFDPRVVSTIRN